jgi:hypothetical protein
MRVSIQTIKYPTESFRLNDGRELFTDSQRSSMKSKKHAIPLLKYISKKEKYAELHRHSWHTRLWKRFVVFCFSFQCNHKTSISKRKSIRTSTTRCLITLSWFKLTRIPNGRCKGGCSLSLSSWIFQSEKSRCTFTSKEQLLSSMW